MKTPRGMERIEQPAEDLTEKVALRGFHAIAKIIADGLPSIDSIESKTWQDQTISRGLTNQEAKVAVQIAIWIEAAAKDIAKKLVSASDDERKAMMKAWLAKDADVQKYSSGLSSGRPKGAKANQEKSAQAKAYWMSVIKEKRKQHQYKGKKAIYEFIKKDIDSGKHELIKDSWPSFETAKKWIPARTKKNV